VGGFAIPSDPLIDLSYNRCNWDEVLVVVAPVDKPPFPYGTNPVGPTGHKHPTLDADCSTSNAYPPPQGS